MLKKIFPACRQAGQKIVSSLPQIVALLFVGAFAVYAWTGPTNTPPNDNVPAPVNVGSVGQTKSGDLTISRVVNNLYEGLFKTDKLETKGGAVFNTGGASTGLIVQQGTSTFAGKVGIGTDTPSEKLEVQGGNVKVSTVTIKGDGSMSPNLNSDKLDNYHAEDLMKGVKVIVIRRGTQYGSRFPVDCYSGSGCQTRTGYTMTREGATFYQVLYNFNNNSFGIDNCPYIKMGPYYDCQQNTGEVQVCASGLVQSEAYTGFQYPYGPDIYQIVCSK